MEPLSLTHEEFEIMWEAKNQWIVLFTSSTCAPCKRIDKTAIAEAAGIPFFVCDTKLNRTTTDYCNITRVPSLVLMQPQKVISTLSGVSDTEKILEWIEKNKRPIGEKMKENAKEKGYTPYSFAIDPEGCIPAGTANESRISNSFNSLGISHTN